MTQVTPRFPDVLREGDMVRVIAPAFSLNIISPEVRAIADERLRDEFGLTVTYGERSEEIDETVSSSIEARVQDLHDAFADPEVKGIFSAIGGYSSNQLLSHLDWDLIRENPKTFCGFSDVNAIGNAILRRAGFVTYSGPHYSSLGQKIFDPYTTDSLRSALFERGSYVITPSTEWTDDEQWFIDQDTRTPLRGEGHWVIQPGEAQGTILGGNLCTFNLLQGTAYAPSGPEVVAFAEDTRASNRGLFDRDLQSLLHTQAVKGLVLGRFQKASGIDRSAIERIISTKSELEGVPVVANVDFGHTFPMTTYPIGGEVTVSAHGSDVRISVINEAKEAA